MAGLCRVDVVGKLLMMVVRVIAGEKEKQPSSGAMMTVQRLTHAGTRRAGSVGRAVFLWNPRNTSSARHRERTVNHIRVCQNERYPLDPWFDTRDIANDDPGVYFQPLRIFSFSPAGRSYIP